LKRNTFGASSPHERYSILSEIKFSQSEAPLHRRDEECVLLGEIGCRRFAAGTISGTVDQRNETFDFTPGIASSASDFAGLLIVVLLFELMASIRLRLK